LRLGKNITLPPYSPILLGVNMAQVKPQKTASIARHTDMGDNCRVKCHHFNDSSTQLRIISNTTNAIVVTTLL
jgi:hypothetical protein